MTQKSSSTTVCKADPSDVDDFDVTADMTRTAALVRDLRLLRKELKLSQAAFAQAYKIPVGTLRDWEQGRNVPTETSAAYLRVILDSPSRVAKVVAA